jgi:hypothetical protein
MSKIQSSLNAAMRDIACAICGTPFRVKPSDILDGRRFCSHKCKGVARKGIPPSNATHMMTGSPTWRSWQSMRSRCLDSGNKDFKNYGARGITIAPEWTSFERFYADMGDRPAGTSLGRLKNDAGYCANNCRWETSKEQANNRRSNKFIEAFGRSQTIAQWAAEIGCSREALRYRVRVGWAPEIALTRSFA